MGLAKKEADILLRSFKFRLPQLLNYQNFIIFLEIIMFFFVFLNYLLSELRYHRKIVLSRYQNIYILFSDKIIYLTKLLLKQILSIPQNQPIIILKIVQNKINIKAVIHELIYPSCLPSNLE
jgi:hypothetical protein